MCLWCSRCVGSDGWVCQVPGGMMRMYAPATSCLQPGMHSSGHPGVAPGSCKHPLPGVSGRWAGHQLPGVDSLLKSYVVTAFQATGAKQACVWGYGSLSCIPRVDPAAAYACAGYSVLCGKGQLGPPLQGAAPQNRHTCQRGAWLLLLYPVLSTTCCQG